MRNAPLIFGIVGKKRSGKDSVAKALSFSGVQRIAFADELKRHAMELWDLSFEQVYGDDLKEVVDERWGVSPRHFLQVFGTEVCRNAHVDTWTRKTLHLIDTAFRGGPVLLPDLKHREFRKFRFNHQSARIWAGETLGGDVWSIPDVRFRNEAQVVKDRGGYVIKVIRPGLVSDDTHQSEVEVDLIEADHTIVNDGAMADLEAKVSDLARRVLS